MKFFKGPLPEVPDLLGSTLSPGTLGAGAEFLEVWLPKLALFNTCFLFFNGYFVIVAIINLVFKLKTDSEDLVFAVAFLKDRVTIVLPILPFKPSIAKAKILI